MKLRGSWRGSLSLATSRPGIQVRCVQVSVDAFNRFWDKYTKLQSVIFPALQGIYIVRSNVSGNPDFERDFRTGILLSHYLSRTPLLNASVGFKDGYIGEVYFPFHWFDAIAQGRP